MSKEEDRHQASLARDIVAALADAGLLSATVQADRIVADLLVEQQFSAGSYGVQWPGKEAARELASGSYGGALPRGWNRLLTGSSHLVVEGDNLDVLQAIREQLAGQVSVIYIDPPYNTGRDFAYRDKYRHSREDYNSLLGDDLVSADRFVHKAGFRHSAWLSMMYPRLLLAWELLRDDGVIMVSIDDNELAQLGLLMQEVFGEDNRVTHFVWRTKNAARGVPPRTMVMTNHEYVLVFAKNIEKFSFRGVERDDADFANPDNDPRGLWRSESMKATGKRSNFYTITDPATGQSYYGNWAFAPETVEEMIADNRVIFPATEEGTPRQKKFLSSYRNPFKAFVSDLGWHSTENATKELMTMFDGRKVFDFPKPLPLLKFLLAQTATDGIVLDFFAGSGSTGQAVLEQNQADGGSRRFLLVQNSEELPAGSPAWELGCETIADLCRLRVLKSAGAVGQLDSVQTVKFSH